MPLIDLLCHYGVTAATLAVRPPDLAQAGQYATQFGVELLCFTSAEASTDLRGGNARLAEALTGDSRHRGWLTLSVHQPEHSHELARLYLTRSLWIGSRFLQNSDADAVNTGGGYELLNSLRRYGRPVLITATTPGTLHAVIAAAKEFHTLRFLLSPQNEDLAADALPAIKEILNISLLPVAACAERDIIARALATIGERRVLWGSDWGRYHHAAALGMLKDAAITQLQRDRVAYRNAKELLGQTATQVEQKLRNSEEPGE